MCCCFYIGALLQFSLFKNYLPEVHSVVINNAYEDFKTKNEIKSLSQSDFSIDTDVEIDYKKRIVIRVHVNDKHICVYKVKFGIPATNLQTKGDSISFQTPTIEGTVMRRNKLDDQGKHPWKAEVSEDDAGVMPTTITAWYTEVYEPVFVEV